MLHRWAGFIGLWLPLIAFAQTPPAQTPPAQTPPAQTPPAQIASLRTPLALRANYETYAAGTQVAEVETGLTLGPQTYHMSLDYHTTGVIGFFFRGHQFDRVDGTWQGRQAIPSQFIAQGEWRGRERSAEIDYHQGKPMIRRLVPPNANENEPVPASLQANTVDTLSALAQLLRVVAETGRCETGVRTYDGRHVVEIDAHTVGEEMLETSSRSSFAGKTLRCDFSGRMLSGFRLDSDRARDSRPMHGSAWLAPVAAGGAPLPVRIVFETRWLGNATMYLTGIGAGSGVQAVRGN